METGEEKGLDRLLASIGCCKSVSVPAVTAIGGGERHLSGMEAVPGDIGLKLGPDTGVEGVRTMIVDSPAEFAHGNSPGRGIRHGGQLTL